MSGSSWCLPLWLTAVALVSVPFSLAFASATFVALATGYVYFDMRVREELEDRTQPAVLPPEVELGYG